MAGWSRAHLLYLLEPPKSRIAESCGGHSRTCFAEHMGSGQSCEQVLRSTIEQENHTGSVHHPCLAGVIEGNIVFFEFYFLSQDSDETQVPLTLPDRIICLFTILPLGIFTPKV